MHNTYKQLCEYSSRFRILKGGKISLVISAFITSTTLLHAAPTGGVVSSGNANIASSGTTTTITQSTNKASINWQSFNIAPSETVNFVQPSSSSVTLNRVLGATDSLIQGTMNANGQVFLINPNGIIFSKGSSVNVGGIVASTLNISDQDFQDGNYRFNGTSTASILNMGTISATNGGYVAMMANNVDNEGVIQATLGNVQLAGASDVTLNINGNSLLSLTINNGTLNALVKNGGVIKAEGGTVYLTTQALSSVLDGLVNNTGIIQAQGLQDQNGHIVLYAHGGTLQAGGTITTGEGTGSVETSGKVFTSDTSLHVSTGSWLIDPVDITIDSTLASTIDTALSSGNVIVSTAGSNTPNTSSGETTATGNGDITVAAPMNWNANTLTLSAGDNININAQLDLTSTAGLSLQYAQTSGSTGTYNINAPVNIATTGSFSTQNGSNSAINYTIIDSLGSAGSTTGTDLQGINGNLSGNYVLGSNIDASGTSAWNSGAGWTPIGNSSTNFAGTFDGLEHTVSGLTIHSSASYVGLFGYAGSSVVIKNLGVIDASVTTTNNNTGILLGRSSSGTIISNSYSTGSVVSNLFYVGGLVGDNYGTISNSYSTASVSGQEYVGGLVGLNEIGSTISNSYSTGSVTNNNSNNNTGGFVGYNQGTINNSYSTGNVLGFNTAGGFVGMAYSGTITNCYSTGNVSGSAYIGGFTGYSYSGTITNSYSTGSVSGGSSYVGGFVGKIYVATINTSFWDTTTSGMTTDNATSGTVGLTDAQMKQQSNFTGFDFANTWIDYNGYTYPLLRSFMTPLNVTITSALNPTMTYNGQAYATPVTATYSATPNSNLLGTLGYYDNSNQNAINAGTYIVGGLYSGQQGYLINYTNTATLTIDPKTLTATISSNPSKVYDGTTNATLASSDYTINTGISGESFTINQTSGIYDSKDVATASSVTATLASGDFTAGSTTLASNYTLPTSAMGSASITPKALDMGLSAENKTYDGTTAATLNGTAALQSAEAVGSGTKDDGKPYIGDTVNLSGTPIGTFASAAANNAIAVNTGLALDNTNYRLMDIFADITPLDTYVSIVSIVSPITNQTVVQQDSFKNAIQPSKNDGIVATDSFAKLNDLDPAAMFNNPIDSTMTSLKNTVLFASSEDLLTSNENLISLDQLADSLHVTPSQISIPITTTGNIAYITGGGVKLPLGISQTMFVRKQEH